MNQTKSLKLNILSILFLGIFLTLSSINAQENDSTSVEKEKLKIVWIPVLASSPANGFMLGVAPSSNWLMGDQSNTSYSSALGSFVYTTKKQFLFTLKGTVFFSENKSILMQDLRYFITSQPTYGLGTGPNSATLANNGFEYEDGSFSNGIDGAQLMKFNFFRLHETYFKRMGDSKSYLGVGYHLDLHNKINDQLLNLEDVPPTITSSYAYTFVNGFEPEKYSLSGISVNFLHDSRDNTVNPYKGMYFISTVKVNPSWLGSSKSSSTLWTEYRTYVSLSKKRSRNILGFWLYGSFQMSGVLPYLDLPAVGWDQYGRSGRGYPQGRFRGQSVVYSETEWRFPLQKDKDKWGGVVYLNASTVTNEDADINLFKYINTGIGVGVRYMVNEKSRTNICLDYGIGNYGAHGFYLSVNEVF